MHGDGGDQTVFVKPGGKNVAFLKHFFSDIGREDRILDMPVDCGRTVADGRAIITQVNSDEIREAMSEPINAIIEAVRISLERTPPELGSDIVDRGIVLTGGGTMLANFDTLLRKETGLPVFYAEEPITGTVTGAPVL